MKRCKLTILFVVLAGVFMYVPLSYAAVYDDVVGYWEMDGDWNDSSGNGNDGIAYGGVSFTSSLYGQGGDFKGDDYIAINGDAVFEQVTISLWLNPDNVSTNSPLLTQQYDCPGGSTFHGRGINIDGGILKVFSRDSDGLWKQVYLDTDPQVGTWYHATLVQNGDILAGYLNGEYIGQVDMGGNVGGLYNGVYNIAKYTNSAGFFFDGIVDDVAIYNRALDGYEIAAIYDIGVEAFEYMDEGIGILGLSIDTEEVSLLAQLYADGKAGLDPDPVAIDGEFWYYYADELDGHALGDAWSDGGYNYLYFGSGVTTDPLLGGGSAVPEMPPFVSQVLFVGFGGVSLWVKRLKSKRV